MGEATNIQDNCVIRTAGTYLGEHDADTVIGSRVTVGHQACLHGVTLEDEVLVGMAASLQQGVKVGGGRACAGQARWGAAGRGGAGRGGAGRGGAGRGRVYMVCSALVCGKGAGRGRAGELWLAPAAALGQHLHARYAAWGRAWVAAPA